MRVVARKIDWSECPPEIAPSTKESQTFLTVGREYEVHAVAVFEGNPSFQVVDDLGYPSWRANWLFEVVDATTPPDWICNAFHDEPMLLLGPVFVAKDQAAHASMVELEADQVDRFWKRLEEQKSGRSNEDRSTRQSPG